MKKKRVGRPKGSKNKPKKVSEFPKAKDGRAKIEKDEFFTEGMEDDNEI